MDRFQNVEVEAEALVIADNRIIVRSVIEADGSRKGLVVLLPGEFSFRLGSPEKTTMVDGELMARLGESDTFRKYMEGDSFVAPKDGLFAMSVELPAQYMVTCE